ncbi:methylglutaconyl-CoA hydratase [Rhodothermaceae bacterium RA]|nr:methylglutaconyl-CoA hydratase [Rhodothermaceae bacterium RA]
MSQDLLYDVTGRVATITLNRPDKRNALNASLVASCRAALDEAAADDRVRVVVLAAAGKVFSAGADLAALEAMQTASALDNLADSQRLAELFARIYLHPKPVIARVHGHALAGGCGLAAVCDVAVAAEPARFGFTEVRIGFVPAIVMVFVRRKLGEAAARDLLLRGHLIPAREAARIGLITRCVAEDELDAVVGQTAEEIASQTSASAVRLTKQMLAQMPGMGLQEALAYAVQMNAFARGTEDCQAGIAAFLQDTLPPWRRPEETRGPSGHTAS